MAENGREIPEQPKTTGNLSYLFQYDNSTDSEVDKEFRLRNLKERQNEERQKKLEEIRAQALAAQRYKEQQEQERRRRLDEMRLREDARRAQVGERKKAINEAERDRLEAILRRNQEREARIEAKKRNERSNIVFAFGSSTPRMLDPIDPSVSFWGHRRATSTQNIPLTSTSLTRRQSERDLDFATKKRATSAGGLERSGESSTPTTPAGCASGYTGRRRTDLTPTVITSRDSSFTSSRKSLNHSPASSRPSSSMSQQSTTSIASSINVRHRPSISRKPRPASIAITGVTSQEIRNYHADKDKPPIPKQRKSISKPNDKDNKTPSKTKVKSPVDSTPKPLAVVQTINQTSNLVNNKIKKDPGDNKTQRKPPDTPATEAKKEQSPPVSNHSDNQEKVEPPSETIKENNVVSEKIEPTPVIEEMTEKKDLEKPVTETLISTVDCTTSEIKQTNDVSETTNIVETQTPEINQEENSQVVATEEKTNVPVQNDQSKESSPAPASDDSNTSNTNNVDNNGMNSEMTTSMTKSRINTEEEAKAALAERRRLAREEAERQAEQERLRVEAEAKAEFERQQKEEEQVRLLIEQQKAAEEKRLQEAIRETQKREEEERLKREEEERLKQLKEEAEKKAREEAERLKAELQQRLKNEEKERELRRKRVEAIMSRTRGKANANSQQNSEDKNENKSENQLNGTKPSEENGTKNGKDVEIVDNIIPDESMKNANNVTIETINSTDSINSNNSWQATQQYDSLM